MNPHCRQCPPAESLSERLHQLATYARWWNVACLTPFFPFVSIECCASKLFSGCNFSPHRLVNGETCRRSIVPSHSDQKKRNSCRYVTLSSPMWWFILHSTTEFPTHRMNQCHCEYLPQPRSIQSIFHALESGEPQNHSCTFHQQCKYPSSSGLLSGCTSRCVRHRQHVVK